MILEIAIYLFLLIAFVLFIKASEIRIFKRKLSFTSRIMIALVFPILAVFLFVFGVIIIILIILALIIGLLFFLFGGRIKFKKNV